eukprot:gene6852-17223_t
MFVLKNYHMVRLLFNCTIQSPNGSGTQGDHAKEPVAGSDADGNTGVVASSAESVESSSTRVLRYRCVQMVAGSQDNQDMFLLK